MHEQGTMCQLRRWPQACYTPDVTQAGDPDSGGLSSQLMLGHRGRREVEGWPKHGKQRDINETEPRSNAGTGLLLVKLRHGQGRLALCIPLVHVDAHLPKKERVPCVRRKERTWLLLTHRGLEEIFQELLAAVASGVVKPAIAFEPRELRSARIEEHRSIPEQSIAKLSI